MSKTELIEIVEWLYSKAMALPVSDNDRDKYFYIALLLTRACKEPHKYTFGWDDPRKWPYNKLVYDWIKHGGRL